MTDHRNDPPDLPAAPDGDRSLEESETRARRALGLLGQGTRPSPGATVRQERSRHLAARPGLDSQSATARASGWSERSNRPATIGGGDSTRLEALRLSLEKERAARVEAERTLEKTRAVIADLQVRLGHVERAREAAEVTGRNALEQLEAMAHIAAASVATRRRGRPAVPKPARYEAGSLPPDQPVRWWKASDEDR